jgi:hypothetical protein
MRGGPSGIDFQAVRIESLRIDGQPLGLSVIPQHPMPAIIDLRADLEGEDESSFLLELTGMAERNPGDQGEVVQRVLFANPLQLLRVKLGESTGTTVLVPVGILSAGPEYHAELLPRLLDGASIVEPAEAIAPEQGGKIVWRFDEDLTQPAAIAPNVELPPSAIRKRNRAADHRDPGLGIRVNLSR